MDEHDVDPAHPFDPPGIPVAAVEPAVIEYAPTEAPMENEAPSVTDDPEAARIVIARSNGSGQREVSVQKYAELVSDDPSYIIIETTYVRPHHSDNV